MAFAVSASPSQPPPSADAIHVHCSISETEFHILLYTQPKSCSILICQLTMEEATARQPGLHRGAEHQPEKQQNKTMTTKNGMMGEENDAQARNARNGWMA